MGVCDTPKVEIRAKLNWQGSRGSQKGNKDLDADCIGLSMALMKVFPDAIVFTIKPHFYAYQHIIMSF